MQRLVAELLGAEFPPAGRLGTADQRLRRLAEDARGFAGLALEDGADSGQLPAYLRAMNVIETALD